MKSIVKLIGISSCCLTIGVTAVDAEPTVLADAELDRVAAGACLAGHGPCNDTVPGGRGLLNGPYSRLGAFWPPSPSGPEGPRPTEPPGCETGACGPGPGLFPGLPPLAPIGFPPPRFVPIFWPSPGGYCGPACDPGPVQGPAGG